MLVRRLVIVARNCELDILFARYDPFQESSCKHAGCTLDPMIDAIWRRLEAGAAGSWSRWTTLEPADPGVSWECASPSQTYKS